MQTIKQSIRNNPPKSALLITEDHLRTATLYDILMVTEYGCSVSLKPAFNHIYTFDELHLPCTNIPDDVKNIDEYALLCQIIIQFEGGCIKYANYKMPKKYIDKVLDEAHNYKLSIHAMRVLIDALDNCGDCGFSKESPFLVKYLESC